MRSIHVVSHTHWDREWYRSFQEFRLKLALLVDGLLEILAADGDFKYFMLDGQTIVLDDYLLMRPENEQILREHIRSGRIVIGPWHILPDMFLVSPEAHIRNLLEGERTARKFGPKMMVGYMPDSFGHIGQMPQILNGFGIENACLWRGLDDEPAEFWWQSPDGSRVLMAYLRESYSNGAYLPGGDSRKDDESGVERFAETIAELGQTLAEHSNADDLLIMLGTDHMRPSPNTARNIAGANARLSQCKENPTRVIHSTLETYFAAVRAGLDAGDPILLPTVQGELRGSRRMPLLPGALSTRMWIKQRNGASENLLTKWLEPFSAFAQFQIEGQQAEDSQRLQHTGEIIRQTWRLLMENHPHDSICGCSIDQVHDEMKVRFDQVDQIGEELTQQALETLAGRIRTISPAKQALDSGCIGSIIVFNPSPFERSEQVSAEISLGTSAGGFQLINDQGQEIVCETVGLGAQDLINTQMTPKEFHSAFRMVNDGRVIGLGIQAYSMQREGSLIHLDITLADEEPDRKVWEQALRETEAVFTDESVTGFALRAHTPNKAKVIFIAGKLPALGWRVFSVLAKEKTVAAPLKLSAFARAMLPVIAWIGRLPAGRRLIQKLGSAPASKAPHVIENEFFRVEVEPDGTLSALDRVTGIRYPGLNQFIDGGDCGDEYNYSAPQLDSLQRPRLKNVIVKHGAVEQTLEIQLLLKTPAELAENRKSRSAHNVEMPVTTRISLSAGVPRMDVHARVENLARDHRLRVHFPTALKLESAEHDGHFEIVTRKMGLPQFDRKTWVEDPRPEVPQRAFSDISNEQSGLTIANRGLPEVEALNGERGAEIALTLLRCVGWLSRDDLQTRRGHAGPGMKTPGAQMPGAWEFDYAIIPHAGRGKVNPAVQAYAFETPLRAVSSSLHEGYLPGSGTFLKITSSDDDGNGESQFTLSAIKTTVDGNGWLVRGYNPGQKELEVTFTPLNRFQYAGVLNLAEKMQQELTPEAETGAVRVRVRSKQVVSLWFGNELKKLRWGFTDGKSGPP